jgi:hypothetical protein
MHLLLALVEVTAHLSHGLLVIPELQQVEDLRYLSLKSLSIQ